MDTVLNMSAQDLDHALVDDLKERFGNAKVEIRVHDIPDAAGMLGEADFWALIDQLDWKQNDQEQIIEPLVSTLSNMSMGVVRYVGQVILKDIPGRVLAKKIENDHIHAYLAAHGNRPRGNPPRRKSKFDSPF